MKDFKNWGVKIRENKEESYKAIWYNLKTIRVGEGKCGTLPIDEKEFLDISLNTKCNACCDFCYVAANKLGVNFDNICETWKKWMDNYFWERVENRITYTNKPFQIAIGEIILI